jgi:hypothetical protein
LSGFHGRGLQQRERKKNFFKLWCNEFAVGSTFFLERQNAERKMSTNTHIVAFA